MRLALSSAAAPDASFDELLDACVRRGFSALELECGHGHLLDSVRAAAGDAAAARARAAGAGVHLAGLRLATDEGEAVQAGPDQRDQVDLLALVRSLGVPLLVPAARMAGAPRALDTGRVMVVLPAGGAALPALDDLDSGGRSAARLPLAWDVDPTAADTSAVAGDLIARAGSRLRHVRLYGGGPESSGQEGRGIGSLMARLALSGFTGTLALAPSSASYRVAWSAWLGQRGGWGCGSTSQDRQLVTLGTS
jgi:hypothetical protein